jgi:tRNA 2-thiouridine synthesizing protein E
MSTVQLAGQDIELDAEGFMLNPDQWTPEIAAEIAREAGIDPLT